MSNSPIGGDSPSSGAASRLKSYKNKGLDSVELRRQREEEGVQLRKQKRDEQVIASLFNSIIASHLGEIGIFLLAMHCSFFYRLLLELATKQFLFHFLTKM